MIYIIQAYIIFDALRSPSRAQASRMIAQLRNHMDEETFMTQWRTLAGDHPLPVVSAEESLQLLLQVVIDFINAPTWEASKRFLESHPELLQPEIDALLQYVATQQEQDGARERVEDRRLLLARCRDEGIDGAFEEALTAEERQQQLLQVVINFINAPTWEESKRILESHPELLQPEIDALLQDLATQQEQDGAREIVEGYRLLLARCRDKGIDVAFAEIQASQERLRASVGEASQQEEGNDS